MRKLKFHEKKLLKKVNLYNWKHEQEQREVKILRRYHVQNRDDYERYNRICGSITKIISKIKALPSSDLFRQKLTE